MAILPTGVINSDEYERSAPESTPLPPGVYSGIVVKTGLRDVKNNGVMLEIEFDITAPGEFQNRKFWDNFNLVNANADAVRISKENLADLAKAAHIAQLQDDEQLIGKEVQMELAFEKGTEYKDKHTGAMKMGKDKNKCRKYWPIGIDVEQARKHKSGTTAPAASAAQPAATGTPWNRSQAAPTQAAPAAAAQQSAAQPMGAAPWKRAAK